MFLALLVLARHRLTSGVADLPAPLVRAIDRFHASLGQALTALADAVEAKPSLPAPDLAAALDDLERATTAALDGTGLALPPEAAASAHGLLALDREVVGLIAHLGDRRGRGSCSSSPRRGRRRDRPGALRHPHGDGQHGHRRGAGRPLLGRPDAAGPRALRDRRGPDAGRDHPGPRPREEGGRPGQPGHGATSRRQGRADRASGRRGRGRAARRRLPALRVADRLGDPVEHERQRGDRQPRQRARRPAPRQQVARPPERRREHVAVLERRLPHRHAHRRGRRR